MDDRTLLEKAAKAAGYTPIRWTDDGTALLLEGVQQPWNALNENPHCDCMGDALRLAVKLSICLEFSFCEDDAPVVYVGRAHQRRDWPRYENFPDPHAATRRAIVRAAAAMADATHPQDKGG